MSGEPNRAISGAAPLEHGGLTCGSRGTRPCSERASRPGVTGSVVSWPCTTIATLSPTSSMSQPRRVHLDRNEFLPWMMRTRLASIHHMRISFHASHGHRPHREGCRHHRKTPRYHRVRLFRSVHEHCVWHKRSHTLRPCCLEGPGRAASGTASGAAGMTNQAVKAAHQGNRGTSAC